MITDSQINNYAVSKNAGGPLHRQLRDHFARLIRSGELRPGEPLPAEAELCATLSVSRFTLRQALDALVQEGLVTRYRGRGTFVARLRVVEQPLSGFYGFANAMAQQGIAHYSRVEELARISAAPDLAAKLRVSVGDLLVRIVRIRYADNEPWVIETSHLTLPVGAPLKVEDLVSASLYDVLEVKSGTVVTKAEENIRPVLLSTEEHSLLCTEYKAAFRVERTAYAGEMPVEWRVSLVRGDRFTYSVELPRK